MLGTAGIALLSEILSISLSYLKVEMEAIVEGEIVYTTTRRDNEATTSYKKLCSKYCSGSHSLGKEFGEFFLECTSLNAPASNFGG